MTVHKDEETFLDDVTNFIKAGINAEIDAINLNKDDGIECPNIQPDRFFESMNDEVFNFANGFIYYGIKLISPTSNMTATSSEITLFFDFLHLDDLTSQTASHKIRKKVMRCGKALRQVIQKNFKKVSYASELSITTLSPQNFKNIESGDSYKMGGVELTGTIWY